MELSPKSLIVALTVGSLAISSVGNAGITVTNIDYSETSRFQIGNGFANSFTTGGLDAELNSVTFFLKVSDEDMNFTINICSDNSGSVGSVVASSFTTVSSPGIQSLTLTGFTGDTLLDASTTYWLTITADGVSNASTGWFLADTESTSSYGWQINHSMLYYSASSWYTPLNSGWGQFSIDATVVPEPSTYAAAFGLAALGFAAVRRKRR